MEKVIFDTNLIRNSESKQFLGGRNELQKFAKVADIVFPDIVIEEIKHQKSRSLKSKKQSFLSNPFHWLKNLDRDETERFDIDAHITDLEDNEDLKYEVIELTDYTVLKQMKELALKKLPPFESGDNTDKGFKDAYIYFTILEYLQSISDKTVFVCTKDGRLKEALQKHPSIVIVKDYEDFIRNSITAFYDDYFIEKLNEEIDPFITKADFIDYWVNINENRVLLIKTNDGKYVVEVDSGEIIAFDMVTAYSETIDDLINSDSFEKTHTSIEALDPYKHFLSDDEIVKIFEAFIDNSQIYGTIGYGITYKFIRCLYSNKKRIVSPELRKNIKKKLSKK